MKRIKQTGYEISQLQSNFIKLIDRNYHNYDCYFTLKLEIAAVRQLGITSGNIYIKRKAAWNQMEQWFNWIKHTIKDIIKWLTNLLISIKL